MNQSAWASQAREHWRQFQPTKFRDLLKAGKLNLALQHAVELTHREMSELEQAGYKPQEAWEMVREKYLFPPEERPDKEPISPWTKLYQEAIEANSRIAQRPVETATER